MTPGEPSTLCVGLCVVRVCVCWGGGGALPPEGGIVTSLSPTPLTHPLWASRPSSPSPSSPLSLCALPGTRASPPPLSSSWVPSSFSHCIRLACLVPPCGALWRIASPLLLAPSVLLSWFSRRSECFCWEMWRCAVGLSCCRLAAYFLSSLSACPHPPPPPGLPLPPHLRRLWSASCRLLFCRRCSSRSTRSLPPSLSASLLVASSPPVSSTRAPSARSASSGSPTAPSPPTPPLGAPPLIT